MQYGGFWRRVLAVFIDGIIVAIPLIAFDVVINMIIYGSVWHCGPVQQSIYQAGKWTHKVIYQCNTQGIWSTPLQFVTYWLYFTLLESSEWQATLGKRLLKLQVTDMDGGRIGFGKANARYWSKIISALILFIGYIMAAFTERKQALHDIIAKTLVVRNGVLMDYRGADSSSRLSGYSSLNSGLDSPPRPHGDKGKW